MRQMFRPLVAALGTIGLAAMVSSCTTASEASTNHTVRVVATTTVVADFARVIGANRVSVYDIMKPNVDAHDFEPTAADILAMHDAAVIVKNGVGLEATLDDPFRASDTHAVIVDSSEGVAVHDRHGTDPNSGDPHIWHDPRNAKIMVTNIANGFTAADPAGAEVYLANLTAYLAQLDQLDNDIADEVATITNKKLVTNHDAFGYFASRYGFDIVGSIIPSFDTSAELSAGELQTLVKEIRAQDVRAVFSESSLPAKTARALATEAGVRVVAGEDALYGDGLGTSDSAGATYLQMMRHNATTIVTNLR